jgi:hypothetical protein
MCHTLPACSLPACSRQGAEHFAVGLRCAFACCARPPLPAAGSSPYFRSSASSKRQPEGASRGATLYSVLLEFWVTDSDEPVPLAGGGKLPAQTAAGRPMW